MRAATQVTRVLEQLEPWCHCVCVSYSHTTRQSTVIQRPCASAVVCSSDLIIHGRFLLNCSLETQLYSAIQFLVYCDRFRYVLTCCAPLQVLLCPHAYFEHWTMTWTLLVFCACKFVWLARAKLRAIAPFACTHCLLFHIGAAVYQDFDWGEGESLKTFLGANWDLQEAFPKIDLTLAIFPYIFSRLENMAGRVQRLLFNNNWSSPFY